MALATTRQVSAERVPLIDFASFRRASRAEVRRVVAEIAAACETVGFLYLKNHGVAQTTIDATFEAARFFFALPLELRMAERLLCTPASTRGYMPLMARHYPGTGAPDLMEAFKIQAELPADDPDIVARNRVHQPNRWPEGYPDFRASVLDYFGALTALSERLLRAFALALELEEDYFLAFYRKPLTQVSLLHYPAQPPTAPEDEYGIRPHADATAFTILAQDEVGGLQVLSRAGDSGHLRRQHRRHDGALDQRPLCLDQASGLQPLGPRALFAAVLRHSRLRRGGGVPADLPGPGKSAQVPAA